MFIEAQMNCVNIKVQYIVVARNRKNKSRDILSWYHSMIGYKSMYVYWIIITSVSVVKIENNFEIIDFNFV